MDPKVRTLADRAFIETTVRLQRAGEGAAYTGLKPAGNDYGPAIPAAERAIEAENLLQVKALLVEEVEHNLRVRFTDMLETKKGEKVPKTANDVPAARERVSRARLHNLGRGVAPGDARYFRPRHKEWDNQKPARRRRRSSSMESAMKFEIPKPMKIEHDELHADLVKATNAGGQTGEAAKAVAKVLHSHFVKEEEYALPPLGLLVALSEGKFETGMTEVLKMTDKLEAELPTMLSEHKDIVAALKTLVDAAKIENKPNFVHFAERLMLHAQTEEQVAYPTALLIGRYLKLKLAA